MKNPSDDEFVHCNDCYDLDACLTYCQIQREKEDIANTRGETPEGNAE